MKIHQSHLRVWLMIGGLGCLLLLGSAYFIELVLKAIPCPLCLLQRYVLWGITVLFFFSALIPLHRIGKYWALFTIMLFSLVGASLAGWQIWLQNNPNPGAAPCSANINALFKYYPALDALKLLFNSSADCAKETFALFGVSLAIWSFIAFIGLVVFSIFLLFKIKKGRI